MKLSVYSAVCHSLDILSFILVPFFTVHLLWVCNAPGVHFPLLFPSDSVYSPELGGFHIWSFWFNLNKLWCEFSVSAVHLNKCECCNPFLGATFRSKTTCLTQDVFTLVVQFSWWFWSIPKEKIMFGFGSLSIYTIKFDIKPKDAKQKAKGYGHNLMRQLFWCIFGDLFEHPK